METKVKIRKVRKAKVKSIPKKTTIKKSKSIADFFGVNKNEVDGLEFQKKVRNEWH